MKEKIQETKKTPHFSLSITALTTSLRPLCRASCRKDVSLLFSTSSAPRFSSSFTAATCPSLAAMCSAVFWCKLEQTTVLNRLFGFFLFFAVGSQQIIQRYPVLVCFIQQLGVGWQEDLHGLCVSCTRSVMQASPVLVIAVRNTQKKKNKNKKITAYLDLIF